MPKANVVVRSTNMEGAQLCVDIFRRPDGTYGFDEFRRDPEDNRGWYSVGHCSGRVFKSSEIALNEARKSVLWLAGLQD